ncbi:hypothetical protein AB1046_21065 [Promicromonospora sp. Populi]|uniref:hypothetical protein n=1 Tax=Promicromonospora sp. Populi TaxID=3239420 RepID=UPI0034E1CB8D
MTREPSADERLPGLPLLEGDAERLAPVLADWRERADRLDAWVRHNVPLSTPGVTTFDHHLGSGRSGSAREPGRGGEQ